MRRLLFSTIIVLCFSSCVEKEEESTFEVKDKSALAIKLADMYYMDVYISRAHKTERDSVRKKLENEFEQLHDISVRELDEYISNLKKDKKLFGEVMDSVSNLLNAKSRKKINLNIISIHV